MPSYNFSRIALAVIASVAVSSCTMQFKTPKLISEDNVSHSFEGIRQMSEAGEVDVVMVHGMCTHFKEWAFDSIQEMSAALGTKDVQGIHEISVDGSNATVFKRSISVGTHTVNLAAIVWTPIMYPLKEQLCYDQKDKSKMCKVRGETEPGFAPNRALVNKFGKDTMLDDCLADAMIYEGKSQQAIGEQMQSAIIAAATPGDQYRPRAEVERDAITRKKKLIIVAESLGSKVAFDAINQLANSDNTKKCEVARSTYLRTARVFMAANQIPLLRLAEIDLNEKPPSEVKLSKKVPDDPCTRENTSKSNGTKFGAPVEASSPVYPADPLSSLAMKFGPTISQIIETKKQEEKLLQMDHPSEKTLPKEPFLVAFTDPNDLLSYSLKGSMFKPVYPVLDALISVKYTYFWLFSNPYTIHTEYLQHKGVLNLITCGTETGCEKK